MCGHCRSRALSFVILGLVPRIHKEADGVPVVRWIAGSKSGNDKKGKTWGDKEKGLSF